MVDYSDSELDSKIEGMLALDCHPTHFLPKDLVKVIAKPEEEVKTLNIQKYYASEVIGIRENETPPYDSLNKAPNERTPDETKQFIEYGIRISKILDMDDACDKEGIKFIAKLFRHYCTNKEQFNSLAPHIHDYIVAVLSYNAKVINLAKKAIDID